MLLRFKSACAFLLASFVISNTHAMSDRSARCIRVLAPIFSGLVVGGAIHLSNQSKNTLCTAGCGVAAAALVSVLTFVMINKTPNSAFKDVNKVLELVDSKLKDFVEKDSTKLSRNDLQELSSCKASLSQAIAKLKEIQQYLDGDKQEEVYNSLVHKIEKSFDGINLKLAEALTFLVQDELDKLNSANLLTHMDSNPCYLPTEIMPMDWAMNLCNGFDYDGTTPESSAIKAMIFELSAKIKVKIAEIRYLCAIHREDSLALQSNVEIPPLILAQKNVAISISILNSSKKLLLDLLNNSQFDHTKQGGECENLLIKIEKSISDSENKISEIQKTDGYLQQLQLYYDTKIEALETRNRTLSGQVGQLSSSNYHLRSQVGSLNMQVSRLQTQVWLQSKKR